MFAASGTSPVSCSHRACKIFYASTVFFSQNGRLPLLMGPPSVGLYPPLLPPLPQLPQPTPPPYPAVQEDPHANCKVGWEEWENAELEQDEACRAEYKQWEGCASDDRQGRTRDDGKGPPWDDGKGCVYAVGKGYAWDDGKSHT